jgi:hypothetical protein
MFRPVCNMSMEWTKPAKQFANRSCTEPTGSSITLMTAISMAPAGVLHSHVNFTDEEAKAMVSEAHRIGKRVAAHAIGNDGIVTALRAGVDAIEPRDGLNESQMDEMFRRGTVMVGAYVAEIIPRWERNARTITLTILKQGRSIYLFHRGGENARAQHIRRGAIQLEIVLLADQRKRSLGRAIAVHALHLFPMLRRRGLWCIRD